MTTYTNAWQDATLISIEFAPALDGSFAFFHIKNTADKEKIKQELSSAGTGLNIIAETEQDNHPVLIAKTAKTEGEIVSLLSARGNSFALLAQKKTFEPWKWRGALGIVGQGFDIFSVYLATQKGTRTKADNAAYFLFAVFNVGASLINMAFGAKRIPDEHRMRFLKTQINDAVTPYISEGANLPSPDDNMTSKLDGPAKPKTGWPKLKEYIRSHSVYIDMGLRYFGNMNLILPVTRLTQKGWRNKLNDNPYTRAAGISLMAGKTITAFSKVPDPYNPEPSGAFDKIREKVTFRLGNSLESLSAVFMGYNSFVGKKDTNGVRKNNPASGIANILFMFGYGARFIAPFGIRETNIPELEAHVSECLAQVPPDKLPQLVADISASLKNDLKDNPVEFGQIYTQILTNLNKYHGISLPILQEHEQQEPHGTQEKQTQFANERLKRKPIVPLEHSGHSEGIASPGIG